VGSRVLAQDLGRWRRSVFRPARMGRRRAGCGATVPYRSRERRASSTAHGPRCLLSSGSLVDAAFLVVSGGSRVPEASQSDGVAALEPVGAAWMMTRLRERLYRSLPCGPPPAKQHLWFGWRPYIARSCSKRLLRAFARSHGVTESRSHGMVSTTCGNRARRSWRGYRRSADPGWSGSVLRFLGRWVGRLRPETIPGKVSNARYNNNSSLGGHQVDTHGQ
jgi:hypothetical protein